jgi:hypothetical protein
MADFNWYGGRIKGQVDDRTKEAAAKLAFDIQGKTQAASRVDTGFMRASVYTTTVNGVNSSAMGNGRYRDKRGYMAKRRAVAPHGLSGADAVVGIGAIYAIYVERKYPFFRPAIEAGVAGFPGIAIATFSDIG